MPGCSSRMLCSRYLGAVAVSCSSSAPARLPCSSSPRIRVPLTNSSSSFTAVSISRRDNQPNPARISGEEEVAEGDAGRGVPAHLLGVDQPDERQHGADPGTDRSGVHPAVDHETGDGAEHDADEHRALPEQLQAVVDDAALDECADADLLGDWCRPPPVRCRSARWPTAPGSGSWPARWPGRTAGR